MGVDAQFYTKKKISFDEVKQIIVSEFGITPYMQIYEKEHTRPWCYYHFTLECGEDRSLAFFPKSIDTLTWGTEEQIYVGECALFSIGCWGKSRDILTRIGRHLGGYLDENDCDTELDVYIQSKSERRQKSIDGILK